MNFAKYVHTWKTFRPRNCFYCDRKLKTRKGHGKGEAHEPDHIFARSRGGCLRAPCCLGCNSKKGNLPYAKWRQKFGRPFAHEKHLGPMPYPTMQEDFELALFRFSCRCDSAINAIFAGQNFNLKKFPLVRSLNS